MKNIFYEYGGEPVLRDVNFEIRPGEAVAVCGANGAGKSTLLKILNGLIFPTSGSYKFEGREINSKLMADNSYAKYFHQKVGLIWQNPDVQLFCPSVEEELSFGPEQMQLPEEEIKIRVDDAIKFFELEKLKYRPPYNLSGGEKKKVALASILTMNPAVWTLDEPLSALDEKTQTVLKNFLFELKRAGKTIIFSSHDSNFVSELADRKISL